MASDAIKKELEGLGATKLKLLASGFGHRVKTGGDAIDVLVQLPDEAIRQAIDTLAEVAPETTAENPAVSPATAPEKARGETPAGATPDSAGKGGETAKNETFRLITKRRFELSYNSKKFVTGPTAAECSPMPKHVADHYQAWFEKNDVNVRRI